MPRRLALMVVGVLVLAVLSTGHSVDAAGPSVAAVSRTTTVASAPGDADADGLPDEDELQVGTSPHDPDSDDDGLLDGGDPDIVATAVGALPASAFASGDAGHRTATLSRLNTAEALFVRGQVSAAVSGLRTLRGRVDGCPPSADRDDWIVRCVDQVWVRHLLDLVIGNHFSYTIDPTVTPAVASLPGLSGGPPRPVGAAVAPDGTAEKYVANEVVYRPASSADLAAFLTRYSGTVLREGTPRVLPGGTRPDGLPATTGWYLVRVDTRRSSTADLVARMDAAGLRGAWQFSSEQAARLMALVAREHEQGVSTNPVTELDQPPCTVCEHPTATGHVDAARWWWMAEDDDPTTPGDQGLSTGVVSAWEYLRYKGFPPTTPFYPVWVAVVDAGFDLDTVTGAPLSGGLDYFYSGTKPPQLDEVDGDWTAGGPGSGFTNCSGSDCWHGQLSFGACCANGRNLYGTTGTSGGGTTGAEVHTLLIKVTADVYTIALGIYDALYNYADVINTSIDFECGWTCRTFDNGNIVKAAVGTARNRGAILVASAGNAQRDISGVDIYPCSLDGAVCVGAVTWEGTAWRGTGQGSNYGTPVDIFAPTGIRSTLTRGSAAEDSNDVGEDELALFGGTSCSAPYLSGVVALMKAVNPGLTYDQVRSILINTANPSSDPRVPSGYVDAYRAVAAAAPNQPPTVAITRPLAGSSTAYQDVWLGARVTDPEASGPWAASFASTVRFTSNRDGTLCTATGTGPDLSCTAATLSLGSHVVTATAIDPFGATATATTSFTVVNTPPTAVITYPPEGSSYFTSQQVNLRGYGYDPDEAIPAGRLSWRSSIDGALGTGPSLWVSLSPGSHTITLTVTDTPGATDTDTVTVHIQTGAGYPTVRITAPPDSSVVSWQAPVTLVGVGTDPEDGPLTGSRLQWSSDVDGPLGTGASITVTLSGARCNAIDHVITLTAVDSDGHVATHSIRLAVVSLC